MAELNYKKLLRIILAAVIIFTGFYLAYLLIDIFIILAISFLLASIFVPFVHSLEQKGINRTFSTFVVFAAAGVLIYLGLSVVIPKFIFQLNQLIISLKDFSINEELIALEAKIHSTFPFFNPGELSARVQNFISSQFVNSIEHISEYISSVVSVAAVLVIVPFITFFLLKDSLKIRRELIHIVPNKYFEPAYWIIKRVNLQLGRYVRAWIFDATFVGFVIGFGFYIIGVPYALPLGVIAGLGHLIPYFGPIIGGLPAIVLSIMQTGDLSHVPMIFLVVLLSYTVDNGFVQPYVFSKSVNIHPIFIILLIIAGSQLFGILGMLLAVPTATVIKTAATEFYFAGKNYRITRI